MIVQGDGRETLRKSEMVCAVLLLVVWTGAVYARVVRFEFLNYDDPIYVTANPHVLTGLTLDNIRWAFLPSIGLWHPLTWLSYQLDASLFGQSPVGFHATNLLLHVINVVLVFLVFTSLTNSPYRSLFLALLFGMHPLNVEPVVWVSSRKDVLFALFWLLTVGAYARYTRRRRVAGYLLVTFLFLCSAMSKAMAMTLPAALLLLDIWPLQRLSPSRLNGYVLKTVLEKLPLFLISVAIMVMSVYAARMGGSLRTSEEISWAARLSHLPVYYVRYLTKTFVPFSLSPHYPLYGGVEPLGSVLGSCILLGLITVGVCTYFKRAPYAAVGWFWFLITLAPVSGIVHVGGHSIAARYMYIPSIGLLLMLVWGGTDILRVLGSPALLAPVLGGTLATVFGITSFHYVSQWRSTETVFRRVIDVVPEDDLAHATLGVVLFDRGDLEGARRHLTEALRLNPSQPSAHVGMGRLYAALGKKEDAENAFRTALKIDPENYVAFTNLGALLAEEGRWSEAESAYTAALEQNPYYGDAWNNLGNIHLVRGEYEKAIECYTQALLYSNTQASILSNMGAAYLMQGKPKDAVRCFETALELQPRDADTELNLAVALESLGNRDQALAHARRALELQPEFKKAKDFLRHLEQPNETNRE